MNAATMLFQDQDIIEGYRTSMCQPDPTSKRRRRMTFDSKGNVMPLLGHKTWDAWSVQEMPENGFVIESLRVPRSRLQMFVGRAIGPKRLPVAALSDQEVISLLNQLTPEQERFLRGK